MNNKKTIKIMSAICIALFVVSVLPSQIAGQIETTEAEDNYTQPYVITFDKNDLILGKINEYDTVRLTGDITYPTTPGLPELPIHQLHLALPKGITVTKITIQSAQMQTLPGRYFVAPVQPPQHVIGSAETIVSPDSIVYSSNQPWPSPQVTLVCQQVIDNQNIAVINVFPVQYIPQQRILTFLSSITFVLEGVLGTILDTTPQTLSLEPGNYKYVIITQESWMSNFQPLANWRIQRGITSKVVGRDWIYNTYTGTNQEKIRAFIIDARNTWQTNAILLGGDVTVLPFYIHTVYIPSEGNMMICCDTYYANTDSNFYTSEMWVGRAPVTTTTEITTFINKIFTYEKNPPTSDYVKKSGLFGFDLDGSSDAEDTKITIDNTYIPSNWTMSNVYDSDIVPPTHKQKVIEAVNAGQHLLNHYDHSDYYLMGTGMTNHGLYLGFSDVNAFTNGNKQSIIYSCGCWAAAYDYNPCIAEKWMVNPNGGSVAFVGNTRYGWYQIGNPSALSGYYDRLFYQSFFNEHRTVLGDCFTDHKNSYYPGGDPYFQYVFTELTLLGDPELHMWTENPEAMVVTHPATLPLGTSSYTVHVEKSNGVDISGALVVLWKGTEVYLTGPTNANGDVTLTPSPLTAGTMLVTVTKQNYIPYEGASDVEELTIDPEQSTVVLSSENMPGMTTCPAGDGPAYEHLLVTLRNSGGNPVPDVPASQFTISVAPQPGTQHYSTLSCTFTPVDAQTNANGEIRFTVRGDTSIIGDIQVSVTVQELLLNDQPLLSCKSFDVDVTGTISGTDFVIFGQQWGLTEWDCDFTWDGVVGGSDFVMFGQHWGHHA